MTEEKLERLFNWMKMMKPRKPNAAELREGAPARTRWTQKKEDPEVLDEVDSDFDGN